MGALAGLVPGPAGQSRWQLRGLRWCRPVTGRRDVVVRVVASVGVVAVMAVAGARVLARTGGDRMPTGPGEAPAIAPVVPQLHPAVRDGAGDVVDAYRALRAREARLLRRGRADHVLDLYAPGPLRDRLVATLAVARLSGGVVAGGAVEVRAANLADADPRGDATGDHATVRVVERARPFTVVPPGAEPPPPEVVEEQVALQRVDGAWRIVARSEAPWEPTRVQRPGERWPAVSFDDSVPPPPLDDEGRPASAARSIVRFLGWLHAHRPEPALLDACVSEHGPARDALAPALARLGAQGWRATTGWRVVAVRVRARRAGAVDLAVRLHHPRGALVDATGRVVIPSPAWTGELSMPLVTDAAGRWRLADTFPADLGAWPDATNPLRIP